MKNGKIRIEKPEDSSNSKTLQQEIRKYARMIPNEPEPNMGRVQEIKEEIREGTYLTADKIDKAAAHLMTRLFNDRLETDFEF